MTGCGRAEPQAVPVDPPPVVAGDGLALATRVVERSGSATTVSATLVVRFQEPGEGAMNLSLSLWSPADGRVRLSAHKVGVSGVEALIEADGTFAAVDREGRVIRDALGTVLSDLLGPGAAPVRLVEEIKAGPLPYAATYERTADGLACTDPASGLRCLVTVADDQVTAKTWIKADGSPALRIDYAADKAFDQLHRPSRWTITVPGWDGTCIARLQDLRVLPRISDERMALDLPQGPAVDWATYTGTDRPTSDVRRPTSGE